ncbi:hypothetical protein HYS48_02900 [Candidatus Woesearchaeota archaeon]|nr:hypothetical protein [Candidatus Woesearchaeota archaeon]
MHKLDTALLKELIDAYGPSGYEYHVRDIILREMKKYVHDVYIDRFGNLVAHKKGKGEKIMLAAHMDEVAIMVKEILEDGKIYFSCVGSIEPIALIGQRVAILAHKRVCGKGVITFPDLHEAYPIEKMPKMEDLYVDTGLGKEALEKAGVKVGTYMIPMHGMEFTCDGEFISGKAMDDRTGCFILIELAKKLKDSSQEMYYVFTVQEEVGLYGAQTAVELIRPDWGMAIDTTNAEDARKDPTIGIGKGPCVTVKDSEMISNKCLNDHFEHTSKKYKIPMQFKVDDFGTTDATRIMMVKGGIPSTVIGVALRNIHSTITIASLKDVEWTIELLYHFLRDPPKVCTM